MAGASSQRATFGNDSDSDDDFVSIGTAVPQVEDDEPIKKPTAIQDLTARDKQGRRRFHGAFTGGFSAGYFNTVGTKEGFTPSTFVSSRSEKHESGQTRPEDFMDEEDLEEHGIAPRKFVTHGSYTSEERKRKRVEDFSLSQRDSTLNLGASLVNLISPDQLPIGMKLLRKMGWRDGQGIGPRTRRHKKKSRKAKSVGEKGAKTYGCALPPSDDESDSDDFVPESMSEVTFAPQDVSPMPLQAKDNVHGLGYSGMNPSLALPGSHVNLFSSTAVTSGSARKGIRGQAFGVGAFEDDDEDIYAVDNMSNYDITMQDADAQDTNFGWTAPRQHGKQMVPVHYVGKLLEGFCLSAKPLPQKKKYPRPELPRHFRPVHWFRKKRSVSHLPGDLVATESGGQQQLTALDRGLLLGETPIVGSVFDLVSKEGKDRISATKEAISMTKSLVQSSENLDVKPQPKETPSSEPSQPINTSLASKFKPAGTTFVTPDLVPPSSESKAKQKSLFSGSMSIQPFRKDPVKQRRYDQYLALVKQGDRDPYNAVAIASMTEWEKSRERDEFAKASKLFRPLSAMMSTRFVNTGVMIDEQQMVKDSEAAESSEQDDQIKAAEMKMFGKLTRTELEWHPDKLLCKKFNVPNPYPGSDVVGVPSVKRDKFSVFNFLTMGVGDYQPKEDPPPIQESPQSSRRTEEEKSVPEESSLKSAAKGGKKKNFASLFDVLDDPNFHKPGAFNRKMDGSQGEKPSADTIDLSLPPGTTSTSSAQREEEQEEKAGDDDDDNSDESDTPGQDLFRAIFKNSDSEDSDDDDDDESVEDKAGTGSDDDDKEEEGGEEKEENQSLSLVKETAPSVLSTQDRKEDVMTTESSINGKDDLFGSGYKQPPQEKDDSDDNSYGPQPLGADVSGEESHGMMEVTQSIKKESNDDGDDNDESHSYGPMLPPPISLAENTTKPDPSSEVPPDSNVYFSSSNAHKKSRDKHRSRSKHKKEKKKKSKHKKKEKKKSKSSHKKKSSSHSGRHNDGSSESEADSESSGQDSDVPDKELLNRLREVSKSGVPLKGLTKR